MKRFGLLSLVVLALMSAWPALAQDDNGLITLDDATPAIDVVISLPADTTGAIALDFSSAAVRLADANGATVFRAADARLHGLELNIAPNSGSHTLTVERLPGAAAAYVQVLSLPELTQMGSTQRVSDLAVSLNQEVSLPLSAAHPSDSVAVTIPADVLGVLTATFPGSGATTQVTDASNTIVAESSGGHVDGMNLVLDAGDYLFTLLTNNLATPVVAGVRAVSAVDAGFTLVQAPESPAPVAVAQTVACTALVDASSINLRSGPGTGYSILGYGYRDQSYTVGGRNPEANWVLVGTDVGPAWIARANVEVEGDCADVRVFNIPLHDAQATPLVITVGQASSEDDDTYEAYEEHDDDEHEDREHDDDD